MIKNGMDTNAIAIEIPATNLRRFGLTITDVADALARNSFDLPAGTALRLRIRARDVALALRRPKGISILNVFECVVRDIGTEGGPQVDLRLDANGAALWARITKRSLVDLELRPGARVFAMIKAVAIDRYSLGRRAGGGHFLAEAE